ncbi:MAG: S8 family serine peptidase [Saprospiraceae bacterium]|nr:S8 family serine peptidase [Saprospiraceae bacterium]MDW8484671.1 S8 family serine peptidase [Saprospiraceae bacterium]
MYEVRFGGKKGKKSQILRLEVSPDLLVVRTKDNKQLEEAPLRRESREVLDATEEVIAFPEAGVSVRRVQDDEDPVAKRDEMRTVLKQDESLRFAGRVLQEVESGNIVLYTENFFVKFHDDVSPERCQALLNKYSLTVKSQLPFAPNAYFVRAAEGTGTKVFELAEQLLAEKEVEYCHPELVQERRFKGAHPLQWHLVEATINGRVVKQHVDIEAAWKHTRGKGITIAIIDDGVDVAHPEFVGRIVHPYDATLNSLDGSPKSPDDKHGTACAGVACAAGLPGGASGTAPEANLMPIRLRSGLGSMAEANAFTWAADHGADVISCSWGPSDGDWWNPMDPLHNRVTPLPDSTRLAMEYALTKGRNGKGCVILFAAGNGNESADNDGYVSFPPIITVSACNDTGKRCVYSDFGKCVWVCFPSADYGWRAFRHPAPLTEGLRTTDRQGGEGYATEGYVNSFGGTSAACPGMAGIVALMLAVNPQLTPSEVKELIRRSCVRIDEAGGEYDARGHSIYYGYGRIHAGLAVENALKAAASKHAAHLNIEGVARFHTGGEIPLLSNVVVGNAFVPPRRLLGFSLSLRNAPTGSRIRYRVNGSSIGIRENTKEGEYVGETSVVHRLRGVAMWLEGPLAQQYDLHYAVRLQGRKTLVQAQNGAWAGSNTPIGRPIEALKIWLAPKNP